MIPDVQQYLTSMRKAMTEIILPQVDDDPFAAEQAQLIVATLGLLIDVQDKQYPYAFAENEAYRATFEGVGKVIRAQPDLPSEVNLQLDRIDEHIDCCQKVMHDGLPSYQWLRQANDAGKVLLSELIYQLGSGENLSAWNACRDIVDQHIRAQLDRELSWMRLTGFDPGAADVPAIGNLLFGDRSTLT